MKILLVIDHLDPGGAQHQMVTLAASLVKRGHDVSCFVYYPEMNHHRHVLDEVGVTIHSVDKPNRFSLRVPAALRGLIRQGFDVSLSYLTTPNVYNVLATIGSRVPVVVSERSALPAGRIGFGMRMRFQLYRFADSILVNSDHHRENLGDAFPWMRSKLVTIRNGVDLQTFHPADDARTAGHGKLDLLSVGSVHRGKNFMGLIEALRVHRERFGWTPQVRWAGRHGTKEVDVHAYHQAEQLIERYGLRSHWHWLGVRRDIPELMRRADALIHPSFFEGLPNVVCEALASGLPVLAGRVCDHPWLVGDTTDRGVLFDPSDPIDMALAIQKFATLPDDERHAISIRARRFAEVELSQERLADRYEALFRSVASNY